MTPQPSADIEGTVGQIRILLAALPYTARLHVLDRLLAERNDRMGMITATAQALTTRDSDLPEN